MRGSILQEVLKAAEAVHTINNNDRTIAPIPEGVPVHRERMPDIPQSKPQNKPQNKPVNNSVPASVSDRNEYATLESALKTAPDKGIIRLQTEDGKQYIVLGSHDMEKWDSDESKGRGDGQKEDLLWEVIDYSPKTGNALVVCRNPLRRITGSGRRHSFSQSSLITRCFELGWRDEGIS